MKFIKKPVAWVVAALVVVALAVVGYFTLGPGSGGGYSAPDGGYSTTYNNGGDGHNHDHESYGVR